MGTHRLSFRPVISARSSPPRWDSFQTPRRNGGEPHCLALQWNGMPVHSLLRHTGLSYYLCRCPCRPHLHNQYHLCSLPPIFASVASCKRRPSSSGSRRLLAIAPTRQQRPRPHRHPLPRPLLPHPAYHHVPSPLWNALWPRHLRLVSGPPSPCRQISATPNGSNISSAAAS